MCYVSHNELMSRNLGTIGYRLLLFFINFLKHELIQGVNYLIFHINVIKVTLFIKLPSVVKKKKNTL